MLTSLSCKDDDFDFLPAVATAAKANVKKAKKCITKGDVDQHVERK